jgi:uncharacterized protein YjbJ (UPF0337 family)
MKRLPWLLAGLGAVMAAYYVLNQPGPQYATGNDDIEDAARTTASWGSKQRLAGVGGNLVGKLKEGVGKVTGDDQLAGEGLVDQIAGAVKDTAGQAAQALGETIHELNR